MTSVTRITKSLQALHTEVREGFQLQKSSPTQSGSVRSSAGSGNWVTIKNYKVDDMYVWIHLETYLRSSSVDIISYYLVP